MSLEELQHRIDKAANGFADGDVHLWAAPLDGSFDNIASMELLSEDERKRAATYRFTLHRTAFVTSRSLLRTVLAGYLGCGASTIQFSYSKHGKPCVEYPDQTKIEFNLSHTADQLLIAVTSKSRIGVDIEPFDRARDFSDVIRGCLSETETRFINRAESHKATRLLLRYWTHKEAFLKALGLGLSVPLQEVEVTFLNPIGSIIRARSGVDEIVLHGFDVHCTIGHIAALVGDKLNNLIRFEM